MFDEQHRKSISCEVTPDNWHFAAYFNSGGDNLSDGTYEAIGLHPFTHAQAREVRCLPWRVDHLQENS